MENQNPEELNAGQEVSPGVAPIHDEVAQQFQEKNQADLDALQTDEEEAAADAETPVAAHNVFEQNETAGTAVGTASVPTSSQPLADEALAPEKPYEGNCAS